MRDRPHAQPLEDIERRGPLINGKRSSTIAGQRRCFVNLRDFRTRANLEIGADGMATDIVPKAHYWLVASPLRSTVSGAARPSDHLAGACRT